MNNVKTQVMETPTRVFPQPQKTIRGILLNLHFWILLAIVGVLTFFHYSVSIGGVIPYAEFGLTRHTVDRVLFLIPIVYSAIIFGPWGGMIFLAVCASIMIPRALQTTNGRTDAILEVVGTVLVGLLVNGWFDTLQKERRRRLQTIEQLEKTQQELLLNEKRLSALSGISRSLSKITDLQQALDRALEQIAQVMNLEIALLFVLAKDGQELNLRAHFGVSEQFADGVRWIKLGEGLNGRVAQSGEPLVVEDASHDPRLTRDVVTKERVAAQLIVPVKSRGIVMGTLAVAARGQKRFTQREIETLTAIADEIGVALENSRLYKEQLFMSEQLRESERNYRELFEKAHDAIWVHDLDGNILTANEATARLTGYARSELLGMNVKAFMTADGLETAKKVASRLQRGETLAQPYEQKFVRRDGGEVYLTLTTSLLTRDGKPQGYQHIARDVTEQKRMTENLRFYVQQITRAQEEERKRIARELHDDTAQQLIVLSRQLDRLLTLDPAPLRDQEPLEKLSERVDAILDGVRRFSQDLRPSILDDLGLLPAVEWLASDMTEHFGISVGVEIIGAERRFPPEKELLLFRIAQEALSNVRKHSGAQRAWVTIEFGAGRTILTIKDSGKGFVPPERLDDLAGMAKLGLAGMAERVRLLGGSLRITSDLGKGTTVTVEAPI